MKEDLALDLRVSRKRAGLSGTDLAHLLGCSIERISKLENGKARVSAEEIMVLSLVYRDMPSWPERLSQRLVPVLKERLASMPGEPSQWAHSHEARLETLNGLFQRLEALTLPQNEA
jgi:transcriptional regulator with XRE-family HTH domain